MRNEENEQAAHMMLRNHRLPWGFTWNTRGMVNEVPEEWAASLCRNGAQVETVCTLARHGGAATPCGGPVASNNNNIASNDAETGTGVSTTREQQGEHVTMSSERAEAETWAEAEAEAATVLVRDCTRDDLPAVHRMIHELATYEGMPEGPQLSVEDLATDGFECSPPWFFVLVAESGGEVAGFAMCNRAYSSWTRRALYVEDLFVAPHLRRAGVGRALLQELCRRALRWGVSRLDWHVLEHNAPARRFYARLGARHLGRTEGRAALRLYEDRIRAVAEGHLLRDDQLDPDDLLWGAGALRRGVGGPGLTLALASPSPGTSVGLVAREDRSAAAAGAHVLRRSITVAHSPRKRPSRPPSPEALNRRGGARARRNGAEGRRVRHANAAVAGAAAAAAAAGHRHRCHRHPRHHPPTTGATPATPATTGATPANTTAADHAANLLVLRSACGAREPAHLSASALRHHALSVGFNITLSDQFRVLSYDETCGSKWRETVTRTSLGALVAGGAVVCAGRVGASVCGLLAAAARGLRAAAAVGCAAPRARGRRRGRGGAAPALAARAAAARAGRGLRGRHARSGAPARLRRPNSSPATTLPRRTRSTTSRGDIVFFGHTSPSLDARWPTRSRSAAASPRDRRRFRCDT
ncbi:unnamed protein product, partial [Iphiclides podalirius]